MEIAAKKLKDKQERLKKQAESRNKTAKDLRERRHKQAKSAREAAKKRRETGVKNIKQRKRERKGKRENRLKEVKQKHRIAKVERKNKLEAARKGSVEKRQKNKVAAANQSEHARKYWQGKVQKDSVEMTAKIQAQQNALRRTQEVTAKKGKERKRKYNKWRAQRARLLARLAAQKRKSSNAAHTERKIKVTGNRYIQQANHYKSKYEQLLSRVGKSRRGEIVAKSQERKLKRKANWARQHEAAEKAEAAQRAARERRRKHAARRRRLHRHRLEVAKKRRRAQSGHQHEVVRKRRKEKRFKRSVNRERRKKGHSRNKLVERQNKWLNKHRRRERRQKKAASGKYHHRIVRERRRKRAERKRKRSKSHKYHERVRKSKAKLERAKKREYRRERRIKGVNHHRHACNKLVHHAYRKYLKRAPDAGGLVFWVNRCLNKCGATCLRQHFHASLEYRCNSYVKQAFKKVRGRFPGPHEGRSLRQLCHTGKCGLNCLIRKLRRRHLGRGRRHRGRRHRGRRHRGRGRRRCHLYKPKPVPIPRFRYSQYVRRARAAARGHAIHLVNDWHRFSSSFNAPTWRVSRSVCYLAGVINGHHGHLANLPERCRPKAGRLIFSVIRGGVPARLDVLSDGQVHLITHHGHGSWMSLNGISFAVRNRGARALTLHNNWVDYGHGYRHTQLNSVHKGLCVLSGLIRSGAWGAFGSVSYGCTPRDGRLIFSANNHEHITRVDIAQEGSVVYSGGYTHHSWVNFDGMIWSPTGGKALTLVNDWNNYGHGYRGASVKKVGKLCVLSGLIKSNSWNSVIAVLPAWCRPAKRMIFGGNVHMSSARIDVTRNGRVIYVSGKQQWEWLSLSNINFVPDPRRAARGHYERKYKIRMARWAKRQQTKDWEKHQCSDFKRLRKAAKGNAITLVNDWRRFSRSYQGPTWRVSRGVCYLSGVLRGYHGHLANLPSACRPRSGRLIFSVLRGVVPARLDVLPDGQIHLITHHGTSNYLSLNGVSFAVSSRHMEPVTLHNGWVDYGHGYRSTRVSRVQRNLCVLSGLIRSGAWGVFAAVPDRCQPKDGRLIFSANNHEQISRVDVTPEGAVVYSGGYQNHGWVNFDGMIWANHGGKPVVLGHSWENYGHGYRGASVRKIGKLCVVSGLVKSGNWNNRVVGQLPVWCRPFKRQIFGGNVHISSARVDVTRGGKIIYIANKQHWEWLSLSNIHFVADARRGAWKYFERRRRERAARRRKMRARLAWERKQGPEWRRMRKAAKGRPMQLLNGYRRFSRSFQTPSWRVIRSTCYLSGIARGVHSHVANLPEKCRPRSGRLIFSAMRGGYPVRLDITADGQVHLLTGSGSWVSFNGVSFTVRNRGAHVMALTNGWVNYGHGYRASRLNSVSKGLCTLSGLIRSGQWNTFASVAGRCAPKDGRLIFSANNHETITRVDVLNDGQVVYAGGSTNHGWVNFDGMIWSPRGGKPLVLGSGWSNYGYGYRGAHVRKIGRLCVVSGLVKSPNWNQGVVATLPRWCRPYKRLFGGNVHTSSARIDVSRRGKIVYQSNKQHWEWLSLSNIHFVADPRKGAANYYRRRRAARHARKQKWLARRAWEKQQGPAWKSVRASAKGRPIHLLNGWTKFSRAYQQPSWRVVRGVCYLSGEARGSAYVVGTLPAACRPKSGRLIFTAMRGHIPARLDVLQDGQIHLITHHGDSEALSFNGISFALKNRGTATVTLHNQWTDYLGGYRSSRLTRVQKGLCVLSGLIRSGSWNHFATTSGGCAPKDGRLIFSANNHATITRADITPEGYVVYAGGSTNHGWVNFDGMIWSPKGGRALPLGTGWHNYGYGYRGAHARKVGRVCVVSGLVKSNDWNNRIIATLPSWCRPFKRLIFGGNVHISNARLDVTRQGRIVYVAGKQHWEWVSLSNIHFVADARRGALKYYGRRQRERAERLKRYKARKEWESKRGPAWKRARKMAKGHPITLHGGMKRYGGRFHTPSWRVYKGICSLSGIARGFSHHIATLPEVCRPKGRLIFPVLLGGSMARVDVLTNGRVEYIAGGEPHKRWMSFNGITFALGGRGGEALELSSNWVNYGHGYRSSRLNVVNNMCVLSGLIRSGSWSQFALVPEACRPSDGRLIFTGNNHATVTRVDVDKDGQVWYAGGTQSHHWANFDSMVWTAKAGTKLRLENGWQTYGHNYRIGTYYRAGRFCVLSGLIRSDSWRSHITTLPAHCRPYRRLVFQANVHTASARVDVLPNGKVLYMSGKQQWDWLSLSEIHFVADVTKESYPYYKARQTLLDKLKASKKRNVWNKLADKQKKKNKRLARGKPIDLVGAYETFSDKYLTPSWRVYRGVCYLSGVARGDGGHIGNLPHKCRPHARLIFSTMKGGINARVDILTDGQIHYIAGGASTNDWISFDGIAFHVAQAGRQDHRLVNGWVNYEYGYRAVQLNEVSQLCVLSGLVRHGQWGHIASVNHGCNPKDGRLIFTGNNHDQGTRLDIDVHGNVLYSGGAANHHWTNFDGMIWTPTAGHVLELKNGWNNYGHGYRPASISKVGRVCVLSGLISHYDWRGKIATLPRWCRPAKRLIFFANVHENSVRIDVFPDGKLSYISGTQRHNWVSLSNIHFIADPRSHEHAHHVQTTCDKYWEDKNGRCPHGTHRNRPGRQSTKCDPVKGDCESKCCEPLSINCGTFYEHAACPVGWRRKHNAATQCVHTASGGLSCNERCCQYVHPGDGKCAYWGDPHLVSFDNKHFDCHTQGEYILFKDEAHDEEIHNFQTKIPRRDMWMVPPMNTGFAFRSRNHVISFELEPPQWQQFVPALRYNGALIPYPTRPKRYGDFMLYPSGGALPDKDAHWTDPGFFTGFLGILNRRTRTGGLFNFRMWAGWDSRMRYLDLLISNAKAHRGSIKSKGMCGNWDGNADNDLIGADGRQCHGGNSNDCCLTWRVPNHKSLFRPPTKGFNFHGLCTLSPSCASGWKDTGSAGVILHNDFYKRNEYPNGGAFNPWWTWKHPRICCAENEETDLENQYTFAKTCPAGSDYRGTAGFILQNKFYRSNPFHNGGAFNGDWTWSHPYVCKTKSKHAIEKHSGLVCMIAKSDWKVERQHSHCPSAWEDYGYVGMIVPSGEHSSSPFAHGGNFNGAYHWVHPKLCCIGGGGGVQQEFGFGLYSKSDSSDIDGNDIGTMEGTAVECAKACQKKEKEGCKAFVRDSKLGDHAKGSCTLKSVTTVKSSSSTNVFTLRTFEGMTPETVCRSSTALAKSERVCSKVHGKFKKDCMIEACSGGNADALVDEIKNIKTGKH